jgi:hypothetical protein
MSYKSCTVIFLKIISGLLIRVPPQDFEKKNVNVEFLKVTRII